MHQSGTKRTPDHGEEFNAMAAQLSELPGETVKVVAGPIEQPIIQTATVAQANARKPNPGEGAIAGCRVDVGSRTEALRQLEKDKQRLQTDQDPQYGSIRFCSSRNSRPSSS